jgi:hypothetical protein
MPVVSWSVRAAKSLTRTCVNPSLLSGGTKMFAGDSLKR